MNMLTTIPLKKTLSRTLDKNKYILAKYLHTNANLLEKAQGKVLIDTTGNKTTTNELLKNKKVVLFGVPGAFTPVCSTKHIPSFLYNADKIKSYGIDDIICVSVNDHFVMSAWANIMHIDDKIKMYADPAGEFTKSIGMEIDMTSSLGGLRSNRYSAIIENGVVTSHHLEPSLGTSEETDATNILAKLAENKK